MTTSIASRRRGRASGAPGPPADAVAEAIVDAAVAHDPTALVGVEVGMHRKMVFVTAHGRGLAVRPARRSTWALVHEVYADAGYVGAWELRPQVEADLDLVLLSGEERIIRGFSDDQNIVVGYACGGQATGFLPLAVFLARVCAGALGVREQHPDRLGPDGKVLVRLQAGADGLEGGA